MPKKLKTYLIHISLFLITLITTTLAGTEHAVSPFVAIDFTDGFQFNYTWKDIQQGMLFSIPFLLSRWLIRNLTNVVFPTPISP